MPSLRRLLALVPLSLLSAFAGDLPPVNFGREVLPILSDKCFFCHGPDEKKRKAGRRLDTLEGATAEKDGVIAVVPGKVDASELVARILSTDPEEIMPPPKSNKTLTQPQRETLKRWVAEGAKWGKHWAFEKPERPAVPRIAECRMPIADWKNASDGYGDWSANPIDGFILKKLAESALMPSREADAPTLCRRLYLDLTGLPPTPEEVDAFLAEAIANRQSAIANLADRLLASPHYGERMALPWLDAARYADSNGFQQDGDTHQWIWRDWVVNALNANMPFDRFTIEQLAGDLLPNATPEQKIASAFNRNHMLNGEGGAIPEEQRNVILFDRVDTTATNWLGLTVACAQCHDHKFDPIKQRDYYSLMAFFNNVPESGTPSGSGQYRIADPAIPAGSPEQLAKLKTLETDAAAVAAEETKQAEAPEIATAFAAWEKAMASDAAVTWTALRPLTATAGDGVTLTVQDDLSIFATGPRPDKTNYEITLPAAVKGLTGFRIETIPDDRLPSKGAGRSDSGNAVLTRLRFSVDGKKILFTAASADYSQGGFSPAGVIDEDPNTAWAFYPDTAKPHFLVVQLPEPLSVADGTPLTLRFEFQSANAQHQLGRFRISATASAQPVGRQSFPGEIAAILKKDAATRSADEAQKLRAHFLTNSPPPVLASARQKKQAAEKALADFKSTVPRVMVMSDAQPRQTTILDRGNYLAPKDNVSSATPAFLPTPPADAPMNRLALARWLMSAEQPLTARVLVNRHWQTFFGLGLVRTSEDFGMQGEQPVQRELLDWLAVEFRESGWDMKRLHRLIVTSATYRQTSAVTPQLRERDPENRLYARASRFRLPSLLIRDQALAASGLLVRTLGGKPVYPYQPASIWDSLAITKERDFTYPQSTGSDLYRRSLYTFWRRTVAPSNIFDASVRNVCKVRLGATNTPLHALTTLNDPTYIEAARVLAAHALHDAGPEPEKRLAFAFRRVLARWPDADETKLLRASLDKQLAKFSADPKAAEIFLKTGASPPNTTLAAPQHAALTAVCLGILNLDEALTKE